MTLIARTTSASSAKGKEKALALEIEEEEVPALVNPDLPHLRSVLSAADVVLHVLDARDPLSHLSTSLEAFCSSNGKKLLYVLNKIGTRPQFRCRSTRLRTRRHCTSGNTLSLGFSPQAKAPHLLLPVGLGLLASAGERPSINQAEAEGAGRRRYWLKGHSRSSHEVGY
jgi:hypothetical protein